MANINEEDEKSEYSDEQFDEEEDKEDEEPEVSMVPRITLEKVEKGLKNVRLLLMIKKVPSTHMAKYMLKGENLERNEETGEEIITTKTL